MDTFSKTMRMLPVLFLALIATTTIYGKDACDSDCKLLKFEVAMENGLAVYRAQHNVPDIFPAGPISSNSRTFGLAQKLTKLICGFGKILVGNWNCISPDTAQNVYVPSHPPIVGVPQYPPQQQALPTLQPCPPTNQPTYQPQYDPQYQPPYQPPYQPQYEPQYQPPCQPQYEPQYQPPYQPQYQPPYQPPNELPPTCTDVLPSVLCGVYVEKKIFPTVGKSELLTMAIELLVALNKNGSAKKKNKSIQAQLEAIISQALRGGVHESGINPDDLVDKLNSQCGIFGCISKCSNKKQKCSLEKLISGGYFG